MALPTPIDVSSQILHKIDAATNETLNAQLAASWIRELDESIEATELRIHDRIQSDLPNFQRQFEKSKQVQVDYAALSARVNELDNIISHPTTGIISTLVDALTEHANLAQRTSDADAVLVSFSSLLKCRNAYLSLTSLVQKGKLPETVAASASVQQEIEGLPPFLSTTVVVQDLKHKFGTTKAWVQDQLSEAFSRSISLSPKEIIIRQQVQVRDSDNTLQLDALLRSLSPTTLNHHLSTLRRDLLNYFVDHILRQPYTVVVESSGSLEERLSLIPDPPSPDDPSKRLANVSLVLDFMSRHVFHNLPHEDAIQFTRSLAKPITASVLNSLLQPTLPTSFGLLSPFLRLLRQAVIFEEKELGRLSGDDQSEGGIKEWANGVSGHYERKRRVDILESTRLDILRVEDERETFQEFSEGGLETSLPTVVPVQDEEVAETAQEDAWGFDEPPTTTMNEKDDTANGWGFDDDVDMEEETKKTLEDSAADNWGFDEDADASTTEDATDTWGLDTEEADDLNSHENSITTMDTTADYEVSVKESDGDADPGDAWGWNEELDNPVAEEGDNWDDPWAVSSESKPQSPPLTAQSPNVVSPKAATRLEKKLASKSKKQRSNDITSPSALLSTPPVPQTTIVLSPPSPLPAPEPPKLNGKTGHSKHVKRPSAVLTSSTPKESYLVPTLARRIMKRVESVIDESKLFYASNLFPESKDMVPAPGSILSHSASSILDLYQALYPVKHAKALESPERGMLFSNSCLYMIGAIQRIEDTLYTQPTLKDRLAECRKYFQILGDSWFDNVVEHEQMTMDQKLVEGTQGFTFTGEQERFDDCEQAVTNVVTDIKHLAQRLKGSLSLTRYYTAIGSVTNAALSRILQDILALPDIPELESHRLSELCRILNSLEVLFSENPEQPSLVVSYVPNWFKFSYLSELLEASLADITYLFEQGMLVDFETGELVNLVRALFADTALRTNTINKLLHGHPSVAH